MLGEATEQRAGSGRIAWLVCFAVPLVLLAILGASRATGEPAAGEAGPPPAEPAIQLDDEGEWEGACVELEAEAGEPAEEAGEECEAEEDEAESSGEAEGCPLRSVHAHAAAHNDRLRVTIGYTSSRGVSATIQVGRGSTHLGTFERHLSRSGVLRFSGRLRHHHGGQLRVSVRVPSEGRYCAEEDAVLFK